MKKTIIFALAILFMSKDVLAQTSIPTNKIQAVMQDVQDQMQGVEETKAQVESVYMQGKQAVNKAKDAINKVTEYADKAAQAIKDPKGAFMNMVESSADKINDMSLADDLLEERVYTKNITPAQYREKVQKDQEMQNKAVADLYGAALAHRKQLLKEEKSEPIETESVNDTLKMTNAKVKEIVARFSFMQMMEAKTDELDYQQKTISFRTKDEEGAE